MVVFVLIVLVVTVTVLVRSNLNVINITISMRYLSSPIISVGLVITTLRTTQQMNIIAQSIFPIRRMRTEDRCLTGVTTSSTPPDCLAPLLSGLNQSEASLWSPDLVS